MREIIENENLFIPSLGVIKAQTFADIYPFVNKYILDNCASKESRDGNVKEMLDIKTTLTNPYRRCVGGGGRNINVFFLLAEAMWIATGRKDVDFLTMFNLQMAAYSDDGKVFHAPYGYRLRHWGVASESEFVDDRVENKGFDQVANAVRLLAQNPMTRQVVMEIWNPVFDLGYVTKDIPCNDIVMLKIRDGKLITTIGNRSNDLHWGLPTNIFQFSFLTELMASALGIELGTQTHNSQSLHAYEWNDVANTQLAWCNKFANKELPTLYKDYEFRKMDFHFIADLAVNRFAEIDYHLNLLIDNLISYKKTGKFNEEEVKKISNFSSYFGDVFQMLVIYLSYKASIRKGQVEHNDAVRLSAIESLNKIAKERGFGSWDYYGLAVNFFKARMSNANIEQLL